MVEETEKFPAQWAIDLIRDPGIYKNAFYTDHFAEIICTITGGAVIIIRNIFQSRPLYATPHYGVIGAVIGFGAGTLFRKIADYRYARLDSMIVDYIKLHPDRFPEPRNKKYADIFEEWHPIR